MLKRLAIVGLILVGFIPFCCPQDTGGKNQPNGQNGPPAPVTAVGNSTPQIKVDYPPQKPPETHVGIQWSNWVLVAVGIVGIFAAIRTLKAIERQGDVMANADRAWVTFVWEKDIAMGDVIQAFKSDNLSRESHHHFGWGIKNIGKQPAIITHYAHRFIAIKSLDELPPTPQYDEVHKYVCEPFLSEVWDRNWYIPLESTESYEAVETAIRKQEYSLYAYGLIKYRDIHGTNHESQFGLIYRPWRQMSRDFDRLELAGPAAYNKYT